jgi:hypothetical protein
MTIPIERTNAVIGTEEFLYRLCDPKKTPGVPKSIRKEAAGLLKHYPSKFHMESVAEREDFLAYSEILGGKVFGKTFD